METVDASLWKPNDWEGWAGENNIPTYCFNQLWSGLLVEGSVGGNRRKDMTTKSQHTAEG